MQLALVPEIEEMWLLLQEVSEDGIGLRRAELVESHWNPETNTFTATHTPGLTDAELAAAWVANAHADPNDTPQGIARVLVFG